MSRWHHDVVHAERRNHELGGMEAKFGTSETINVHCTDVAECYEAD